MSANPRVAEYAIDPQFIERWSPRAFSGESIPQETLLSFLKPRAGHLRLTTHSPGAFSTPAVTRPTGSVSSAC